MEIEKLKNFVPLGLGYVKDISRDPPPLPPWLFQHRDLMNEIERAEELDKEKIINAINYIHFMEGFVYISLSHPTFQETVLLRGRPDPCSGDTVHFHWIDDHVRSLKIESFGFERIILFEGETITLIPASVRDIGQPGITLELPEKGFILRLRAIKRYKCNNIGADLIQNGIIARGHLIDFSPRGLRIRLLPELSSPINWFNFSDPTVVNLREKQHVLFSGLCRTIREANHPYGKEIVVAPILDQITKYSKEKIRSPRRQLSPPAMFSFVHPLFHKRVKRRICDISNSGFSIQEKTIDSVLIPGLILPEVTISYANVLHLKCAAQVVYRKEDGPDVRCGLAILDMDVKSYGKLNQILNHYSDSHIFVSNSVDMDALWEFFFQTGFLYPEKYQSLHRYKDLFKETYRKLYQENPEIACHFTYEQDGDIYGHMSMLRTYERTWMIHHFAARPFESRRTGFLVLRQIMEYLNGFYKLPSANMDYVMAYFQPKNKIANRIFGDFARFLNNPRGCSLDRFSYFLWKKDPLREALPEEWTLRESTPIDLWKLKLFYKHRSGGLLLEAHNMDGEQRQQGNLLSLYDQLGFHRSWSIHSLVYREDPVAFLVRERSDLGINMAQLLNCVKILVTEPDNLPWDILTASVTNLAQENTIPEIPLLIYPEDYVISKGVPVKKVYDHWILNLHDKGNEYLQHMAKNFRIRFD